MAKDTFKPADRYVNPKPSAGGWLGIGSISAADVVKFGVNTATSLAKAAGDPLGTTIDTVKSLPAIAKSIGGTVTRLDDYGKLIQNNPGGKNDARRLRAYSEVQGKGLEDLNNLALVLGAFKVGASPAAKNLAYNTRHSVGQMDVVGQPIRTSILKKEVKNLGNKARDLPDRESIIGSTQVRNINALYSPESATFMDAVERYSALQKIKKSPNLVEAKLAQSKNPYYGDNLGAPQVLYEKIKSEGLANLPPPFIRVSDGRVILSDGHHRVISANAINPKMPAKYEVNNRTMNPIYDPILTPAAKLERALINAQGKREIRKQLNKTPAGQFAVNANFIPSPGLKEFLKETKTPSSLSKFRTSQLPNNVWPR
jgi:hypothetical protein